MLTEFVRDHTFTIAWFGLMTMVWLGWAQEDPPRHWRSRLGMGSAAGVALAVGFGLLTATNWSASSALDGRFHLFGILVGLEVIAAAVGCLMLARTGRTRWMAWWVAVVVALHFVPLGYLLQDWSIAIFGLLQTGGVVWMVRRLRGSGVATSRAVGPWMGSTLLAFALLSAVIYLVQQFST